MTFGENLQYLRREAELTQEQLAERLEVTRQSVSKWESNAGFPEMEKLLVMCDLFHTDLDTLLRGDVQRARQEDTAGYDAQMNRFCGMITAGVVLCILGFSLGGLIEGLGRGERWSGAAFLLCVLAAVVLFIIGGIQHGDFCKRYPYIEPFYDEKALAAFRQRFPVFIAVGTALCIAAVMFWVLFDGVALGGMTAGQTDDVLMSVGMLLVAAGVGLLVYGGIQHSKYDVELYNRERANEKDPKFRRLGRLLGAIMLVAAAIYLTGGFTCGAWGTLWWVFPVGGVLCGIVSTLFGKE